MNPFKHRNGPVFFGLLALFFLFITPAHSLIIPPDPFESTDRFALLTAASDGAITQVSVKVKALGPDPLSPGELWALLQYKVPGNSKFFSSASNPINIQGLTTAASTLFELDFSNEPIPSNAFHRTLHIYYQVSPETLPLLVAEYRPEQLLVNPLENATRPRHHLRAEPWSSALSPSSGSERYLRQNRSSLLFPITPGLFFFA